VEHFSSKASAIGHCLTLAEGYAKAWKQLGFDTRLIMEAIGRTHIMTARTFCLAAGILLLASCGNEPNRIHPTLDVPPGMRGVTIIVKQDIAVAAGDRVDVLAMDKGQEVTVLRNVEVVARDENIVQFVVSPENAKRVEQAVKQGQFKFQLRRN
jgi:uncharacterized lipoprotein YajG